MKYLHKVFHEKSASEFEKTYHARFHSDMAIHVDLTIKPINQRHNYELFYVPSNAMLQMVGDLHITSNILAETFNTLPSVAQRQFIHECLIDELYNTNQLEGVTSTREEIARSTREVLLNKKTNQRFDSMIKSYFHLLDEDVRLPSTPKDIRQIYDDITNGEIEAHELPDGTIFRAEATYLLKKSGSGKIIHEGVTPESEIINLTQHWLKFMNDNHIVPHLIKVAIGHFYFGYIHPFYDGNGRTSRFISSMYLAKELGNISTLSLSRGCNIYKHKYLEAFEIANSIRSRGEMNHFIECFLKIMIDTLEQMNSELKEKRQLLLMAADKLREDIRLQKLTETHRDMMFTLAQNHFFDSHAGLTIKELIDIFGKSPATIRKMIKDLLEVSLIEQRGERPAYFYIQAKYFES
ncbi:Fic family protein [Paenibacillus senegalimassiliensis]|uniref:Fic family protein n=1 Tax=Paenibacillus senegalimassiliensis TaxID=1737426 RepID=UPI00073EEB97|nr:Fic family protein [Paenibacillus senegalimassiliensis]